MTGRERSRSSRSDERSVQRDRDARELARAFTQASFPDRIRLAYRPRRLRQGVEFRALSRRSTISTSPALSGRPRKIPPTRAKRSASSVASSSRRPLFPAGVASPVSASVCCERTGGRRGGIDDGCPGPDDRADRIGEHGKVRAAEHECVGTRVVLARAEHRIEIVVRHGLDDRPGHPAFLGERDEQRTCTRGHRRVRQPPCDRALVRAAAHRALGRDDADAPALRRRDTRPPRQARARRARAPAQTPRSARRSRRPTRCCTRPRDI